MAAQSEKTKFEMPREVISWKAPTRRFEPKNKTWFAGLIVLAVGIFIFLIIVNEFLLGVVVLAFAALLFVQTTVKPPLTNYSIQNLGIDTGDKIYHWDDLESFFVDRGKGELIIRTNLSFPSEISMLLEEGKEDDIEKIMLDYLPFMEIPKTDYMGVIDGFIDRFSKKLPKNFTKKMVKNPSEKLTVDPADVKKISTSIQKTKQIFPLKREKKGKK